MSWLYSYFTRNWYSLRIYSLSCQECNLTEVYWLYYLWFSSVNVEFGFFMWHSCVWNSLITFIEYCFFILYIYWWSHLLILFIVNILVFYIVILIIFFLNHDHHHVFHCLRHFLHLNNPPPIMIIIVTICIIKNFTEEVVAIFHSRDSCCTTII